MYCLEYDKFEIYICIYIHVYNMINRSHCAMSFMNQTCFYLVKDFIGQPIGCLKN